MKMVKWEIAVTRDAAAGESYTDTGKGITSFRIYWKTIAEDVKQSANTHEGQRLGITFWNEANTRMVYVFANIRCDGGVSCFFEVQRLGRFGLNLNSIEDLFTSVEFFGGIRR